MTKPNANKNDFKEENIMFKKFKSYFMENIDSIAAGMAALNVGDNYPYFEN